MTAADISLTAAPANASWVRSLGPFVVMCVGMFIALLDIQIVASSLQDIGDDRRCLSRSHALELALLEVGVHPKVMRRDDGDEIGAAADIGAA